MSCMFKSAFQSSFQTISSFSVPYVSLISGGLKAGKAIFIQGAVPSECESFVVNLKCGESEGDDIAFQIKPHFSSNCIVLNSRQNGSWGKEEKVELPLKQGSGFDLIISINSENYQVYLNGCEVGRFQHRIPLDRVIALSVGGEVSLTNVAFTESLAGSSIFGWSASMLHSQNGTVTFGEHSSVLDGSWSLTSSEHNLPTIHPHMGLSLSNPVQNLILPYVGPIPGGLREGMALYLQGVIPTNAEWFSINFKTSQSDSDDTAFHFNPRMDQKVAMNSFRNGGWEAEESISDNPFKKGQAFEMFTVMKSEGYQVYVNGKEQYTFKHRIPLEKVTTLNIKGDVVVNLFGFIQNWGTSSLPTEVTTITSLSRPRREISSIKSEILQPVQNPTLPYVGQISGGLKEGMALYLQGVIPTTADQFALNFKTGQSENDDTAFHFNPRMDQKVAMNSFRNGGWEAEESVSDNPFKKGEAFEMFAVMKSEGYQVYVNGKEQYTFKHRIPLEKVTTLNINGDVVVNLFGFIQNWGTSSLPTEVTTITSLSRPRREISTIKSEILQPVQNPTLPYVGQISGGLKEGMALYLQGVIPTTADQFALNFKTGQSENDDTAFHFNPRMDQKVAMNSFRNGGWEAEESVSDNPFKKGEAFEMFAVMKSEGYQVYVNGKEQYTFKHRIPLEKVTTLNIKGDVVVNLFGFIQNWGTSSLPTEVTTITSLSRPRREISTIKSEILQPVQNPTLPYVGQISGGLKEGMALYLQGVIPTTADQFALNFKTGQSENDDTAFHFNPRMDQKVAMNSFRNGGWEAEESVSDNPFKKGEAFEMFAVMKSEGYQVYVNGKEQYTFKHRIPLEKVTTLNIKGDVVVNLFGFIQNWGTSSLPTEVTTITSLSRPRREISTIKSEILQPVQNPTLPYVGQISGGLKEGMALYLQGVIPTTADQFALNFKTGQSENDDTAFHFNPRMDQKVAMNSFRNGGWEAEESVSDNPFKKGEAFEMFAVMKSEGYQVYVNGKEQYTFKHRIPLEKVTTLNIKGDVVVNLFGFIQNWGTSSLPTEVTTITSLSRPRREISTIKSEILQPVQNPTLPYVGQISGGLKEGMALYLQGVIPTTADQFALNFKTGQSENDDTAFHFNPRMDQKVAMNSFRNGGWEAEESVSDNPFKKGEAFEMFAVMKSEGYQVYVNGKEQYTFKHRIPLEKVTTLNIKGDVVVNLFGFIQNWGTSSLPTEVTTITSLSRPRREISTIKSEILQPVQNPTLPYVGQISGGLKEGMALYLQGVIPTTADQFALNFKTGQSENDDTAFHFNPRMDQKVAMNSFRNGGWEAEESVSDNPFKKGESFEMFAVMKSEGYQVYVNGKEQYTFKHRIPLEKVTTLNIKGDVVVNLFGFIQNWGTSSLPTEVTTITSLSRPRREISTIKSEILQPVQNPTLPYVGQISGGLKEGMALYLQGVIPTTADQFALNFKTGQSENDDTAFHFNPRMDQKVAMNSFRNGGWEAEESVSDNPFKKGESFEMFAVMKSEGYQVYVNGKEQYTFKHRIPLEKVTTLNIKGDVVVNLFGFIQNWGTSSLPTEFTTITSLSRPRREISTIKSEILQPVQNPTLPYVGQISGGLKEGMALYLQGVIPTTADQFALNFKTGQSENDDTAFHFNPRMDQKVAMNSFRNGGWEAEESVSDNPFKKGEAFEMFAVMKSEGYQVYVNGKEQYTFKHRIPLEKVTTLNIKGDVVVNLFGFIQNWGTSSLPTEVTTITSLSRPRREISTIKSEILQPVQNPTLPYVGQISGGLKEGMALYLQGVIPTTADQFALNFKTGQSENDDTAFHFNPRMDQKVAMNSFRNGGWEAEESVSDNPFKKGEAFEMFAVMKSEGYQVYVNGKEQYTFKHRIPLEKVTTLNIKGDVVVNLFGFIQNWGTSSLPTEVTTITSLSRPRREISTIKSEILQPVQNPTLPYVGQISGGLKEGMALYLQGVIPTTADQFALNFKTGQSENDDTAFHFNPRMDQKVAMNSFRNGGWEAEESVSDNPFKKGEAFEMFAVMKSEGYQVYVNGKEQYTFKHRIPLEKVTTLNIKGDVVVNLFGFIQNWGTSSLPTEVTTITSLSRPRREISTIKSEILQPVQNPTLPYVGQISGGLKEGMALYLQGVIPTTADQFALNFKTGQSENDDTAFHFNPRMDQKVAMNSFRNGGWEAEESVSDNPFKKGEAFEMFAVMKSEGYQVYVNGKEQYTFKHRIPLEKVTTLNIKGDVVVNLFGFIQNWGTSSLPTEVTTITSLSRPRREISTIKSEILQPVQNPTLPYVGQISGGLKEGMALYLQGVIPTTADQFALNFKTGQSENDDTAFHFNPRMDQKVAMNSFRNGGWEAEESVSDNPFKKGEAFEMFAVMKSEGYQVYVNGKEQYTFKHRIPLEKVTTLNIKGDVVVNLFGFIQNWGTSSLPTEVTTITSLSRPRREISTIKSEILQPVQNPTLPYVGQISGGLKEGMALYLQGVIPTTADQFALNFKTGQSENDDTAFHFNPRMDQKVAMNSFRNGGWEAEESVSDNPFKKGEAFEMFAVMKSEGYQVYVNGKEQYTFKHRIPLEKVTTLNIKGDVVVNLFGFIQNWGTSSLPTEVTTITSLSRPRREISTIKSEILQPVQNPTLPYVGQISGGLKEGMALYLQGVIPTTADQFALNFKTGQSENDDTAFHFNPRMDQKVAMNSFRNGGWEAEESVSDNPFKKGESFEMFAVMKSEGYQVYVNGKEQYTFKHRIPLEKVTTLNIKGDVVVNLFGFIQNWGTSSLPTEFTTITSLSRPRREISTIKSEILQPVQNPTLPYVGQISGGLKEGMALYLQGVIPTTADQFALNFKTGQSENDDTAFHFNPRMDQKVAMNSFRNGGWEAEESVSDNPFKKGEAFEMFAVMKSEGYQVYVNGKEQYTFKHRIPLEKVTTLNIKGDVVVNLFGFIQNWGTSSLPTEVTTITSLSRPRREISTIKSEILQPVQNPTLPYVGQISGGLKEGMALYLQGVIPTTADQFALNFKTGQSENDDTAFHFNPRMDQKVAMNSFRNGGWEAEESVSENPFKKGEAFEMFAVMKSEGYQVYVNGKEQYTFKHRIPLEKVTMFNINGDVVMNLFGLIQNWSTSRFVTKVKSSPAYLGSPREQCSTVHLDILQPVQNPKLPYVAPVSGRLKEGMALYLQGVVPTNANQFELNFKTGQSKNDDIAFQFNPRMDKKVAMNSFRNGEWEAEESVSDNPFKKGQAFEMFTVIRSKGYQVYVNGKELYTFKHRIPLEKVSTLNINGDAAVNLSGFINNWSTSSLVTSKITSLGSSHGELSTVQSEILQPIQNPSLPYVGHISGGLREGMALYLQGVVPTNADKFELNFKTGQSNNDDIAFHFNPQMGKKVVMNSFRNGGWEAEESVSDNPFKKGEAFDMFTLIRSEGYQIYVNGKELYTFKHRIPLEKVSALNISGDVAVILSGFIKNWSKSSFVTKVKSRTAHLGSSRWDLSTIQSEVLQPVQNPTIPYVGPISGGLREGMALYLQGVVPTNANQFRINFKTGPTDKHDTAFHFNPRMGSKVAMNSFRTGKWETEQSFSDNPFKKGKDFEMFFVIKSEGYQVYVNGKEQYTFKHSIPLEKVTMLNINGDVVVNLFGFIQNWSKSSFVTAVKSRTAHLGSPRGALSTIKSEVLQPIQNPTLPYVAPIPEGLREGIALYVQGVIPTNADRFSINFKTGPTDKDDIAFHFNPRMGSKVVMNTFRNGKWGAEERVSDNPFKKGEDFEMFFVIKSEGYQVRIKGQQHSMFKHRIPLEKVTTIHIYGNVSISFLGFVMGM